MNCTCTCNILQVICSWRNCEVDFNLWYVASRLFISAVSKGLERMVALCGQADAYEIFTRSYLALWEVYDFGLYHIQYHSWGQTVRPNLHNSPLIYILWWCITSLNGVKYNHLPYLLLARCGIISTGVFEMPNKSFMLLPLVLSCCLILKEWRDRLYLRGTNK